MHMNIQLIESFIDLFKDEFSNKNRSICEDNNIYPMGVHYLKICMLLI